MANARKILIVDDDTDLRDTLVEQLSLHDEFEASAVDTGAKGASAAKANAPDLVLMDVGLPDTDGREVVRSLRKGGFKAPIIMLTGHDTDSDTILGLESGANDYVAKPFRFAVLLARIRAQLRQHEASEDAVFSVGPYSFRPGSKMLTGANARKPRSCGSCTGPASCRCRARPCCRKSGAIIRGSPPIPWKPTSTGCGRRSRKMPPIPRSW
jgi:DNA-binding response OmpR family regulator